MRRTTAYRAFGFAAALLCTALHITEAPAGEAPEHDPGWRPDTALLEAVLVVRAGSAQGSGFLVDSSGLVLTSETLIGHAKYIEVRLGPGQEYSARPVVLDRGVAVIQVNERVVAGIRPLPLAEAGSKGKRSDQDRTVLLISTMEDGWKEIITARRKGGLFGSVCYDAPLPSGALGGPVLDSRGTVVGINAFHGPTSRRRDMACALPINRAVEALASARQRALASEPPPAGPLNLPSRRNYPPSLARELGGQIADPDAYRARAGKVNLEFLTPPLVHALPRTRDDSYTTQAGFFLWQRYQGAHEPAVVVQALPDLRWTAGSAWRVAGYSVYIGALPVLLLACVLTGCDDIPLAPPPRASYRFKRDFNGLVLLRDGVEVHPVAESVECDPTRARVALAPGRKIKERKVRGCHGVYKYPPEAFAPGAALSVRILEKGEPAAGGDVPLDPVLVRRIWADFQLWLATLERVDRPDPIAPPVATPSPAPAEPDRDLQTAPSQ